MIRGVVFDFDHTLYDRDASDRVAMGRLFDERPALFRAGVTREAAVSAIVPAAHRRIYQGWRAICADLAGEGVLRADCDADFVRDYFQRQFFVRLVRFPFVPPMLGRLRAMGLRLGLITNGPVFYQQNKLDASGLEPEFEQVIIGSDPATAKPHPDLFLEMARRLGCRPDELIYAGDNPVNDVDASRRAGYVPVWVRTITPWQFPDIPECPLQVDTVAELPGLIARLNGVPPR